MRHRMRGRRLNRSPSHLLAMKRNLATSVFAHERVTTTVAKAKELRMFVEPLITLAKRGAAQLKLANGSGTDEEKRQAKANALYVRRLLMQRLGGKKVVPIGKDEVNVIDKLLNDIGPRFANRAGGYTRIIKRTRRRLGDAAPLAILELLGAHESVESTPKTNAPAVAKD